MLLVLCCVVLCCVSEGGRQKSISLFIHSFIQIHAQTRYLHRCMKIELYCCCTVMQYNTEGEDTIVGRQIESFVVVSFLFVSG